MERYSTVHCETRTDYEWCMGVEVFPQPFAIKFSRNIVLAKNTTCNLQKKVMKQFKVSQFKEIISTILKDTTTNKVVTE